jgi:hypothetical protein
MKMTRALSLKATINGFGALALAVSVAVFALPGNAAAQEPSPPLGGELSYNVKQYTVADIYTVDGQPCFSGGSHFTVAPAGGRLVVGLKSNAGDSINVASLK